MADDVEMIPVEAAEPPKANPLAAPKVATLKLAPQARTPTSAGVTSALKPGLKLPPKPGMATGLKLPPKSATMTGAFRPGLKLPPKSATMTGAFKSGLKLPPKPVIRKPGATVAATPLPKPVAVDAQGVGKLPTVEAKAVDRADTAPIVSANPSPMEALKSVTQKLKGITQEIPQQAILHKTGIIADEAMSEGQKEASKHKTARISLSDAMGVAPVSNENAPMKTIRIKRPIDIPVAKTDDSSSAPVSTPVAETVSKATPVAAEAKPTAPAPTLTQRKTLKISRPGCTVRPAGKFGIKRPSAATTIVKSAASSAAAKTEGSTPGDAPVADISDIPDLPSTAPAAPIASAPAASASPSWVMTLSAILQFAACVAIGALAWFLYENSQLPLYCGGLGWQ